MEWVEGEEEEEVEEEEEEVVGVSSVGGGSVGGRVEFPQHGATNGLNRLSSPPSHTSPATLRYLHANIHNVLTHIHIHVYIANPVLAMYVSVFPSAQGSSRVTAASLIHGAFRSIPGRPYP